MSTLRRRTMLAAIPLAGATLMAAAIGRKHSFAAPLDSNAPRADVADVAGLQPDPNPQPVPDFSFTDESGATHRIGDYRGRPVVVNFWATWCMPCVAELPSLDRLAQQMKGGPIAVLALSSDHGGADTVRRFFGAHGIGSLGVNLDPAMQAAHGLGLRGIPTTLLIDAQGREIARLEGAADWGSAASVAQIRKLLAAPAKPDTDAT